MIDPDQFTLCEHDHDPGECPVCRGEAEAPFPELLDLLQRHLPDGPEVPDELTGIPFS